ncbi:MAG TPA: O-antigen ligase family protein [Gaiellaceae bacterium]
MNGRAGRLAPTRPLLSEQLVALAALALTAGLAACVAIDPRTTLIGLAAVTAAAVCVVWIEVPVLALVASGPLELAVTYHSQSQLSPTKVIGAAAFVSFALNAVITHRRIAFDRTHAVVFAILALAMLSTLQVDDTGDAVSTTTRYASFVLLFFIISQFSGDHRLQRLIVWTLSIASTVAGFLAVQKFLSGQELLARLPEGDPNDVAFVLATTLPLTFWLLRERGLRRVAVIAMLGMLAVATVLTFSRGALVGLAAGLLWKLVVDRRQVKVIAGAAVLAAAVIGTVVYLAGDRVDTGLKAKEKVAGRNVSTRLQAWRLAAGFAADHPLLGIGPGEFRNRWVAATDQLPGTPPLKVVHNAYLDIAAELGIVAAVLFVVYLVTAIVRSWTANVRRRGPPGLAGAVAIALVVGSVATLTLSEQYFAPFWLLGGLATALWREHDTAA